MGERDVQRCTSLTLQVPFPGAVQIWNILQLKLKIQPLIYVGFLINIIDNIIGKIAELCQEKETRYEETEEN